RVLIPLLRTTASITQKLRRLQRKPVRETIHKKANPRLCLWVKSSSLNIAQSVTDPRQKVARKRQVCGPTKCSRRPLAPCSGYSQMGLFAGACRYGQDFPNRNAGQLLPISRL